MDRAFSSGASGTPPTAPGSPSTGYATSGNPGTATPATKPGAWWYHMVTEELRKLIVDAGLTPDFTNTSQVSQAVQALIAAGAANDYKSSVRSATTANIASLAGGAPNTLDGVTLVASDRILVKDQTTGSQNGIYYVATLGTGANGTWTRATDADQAGELTSGAIVAVEEGAANADSQWMLTTDGTINIGTTLLTFVRKDASAIGGSIQAGFKNLQVSANGTTALVNATADALVVMTTGNAYKTLYNLSLSANTGAASGAANSLDTGTWAFSTWYYVFVIYNGTAPALLFSLSATAPTLPSGYAYFALVSAIRTQSATSYYPLAFQQKGRGVQQVVATGSNVPNLPIMANGVSGTGIGAATCTWAAIGVSGFVPPIASKITVAPRILGAQSILLAPNISYGGDASASNNYPFWYSRGANTTGSVTMTLESSNIYWVADSTVCSILLLGWELNL